MVLVWRFIMCSLASLKANFVVNMKLDTKEREASKKFLHRD